MELMFDDSLGPAMKAEGEKALRTGLATLEAKLRFIRFAHGSQILSINDSFCSTGEAKDLFVKLFATNSRTELDWQVATQRITNRQMRLLSIWCVLVGESTPRFVTAYPAARRTGARIRP
jgi:hypothetical protein